MRIPVPIIVASLFIFTTGSLARPSCQGQQQPCPDTVPTTGKYENHSYGFSIVIPDSFKGYWNSQPCESTPSGCKCMSDHGRIIPLTEAYVPERQIEAYAGFAVSSDKTALTEMVSRRLADIRKRSRQNSVEIRQQLSIRLGGLKAERVVVRYYDENLKGWGVEDFIAALRSDVEYTVYLRTKEENYERDRSVFEAVVASFTLIAGEYTGNEKPK